MKYKNITVTKYQIIQHIVRKYAENHDNVKSMLSYDKDSHVLSIGGISKPINFHTEDIGLVPQGAYEVVAQAIRSKDDTGHTSDDSMTIYGVGTRVFSLVDDNQQDVFDFISNNSRSSYCACCGTNRDRNNFFYIRNIGGNKLYQVGSKCIKEHFDTSYFDLMKDISDAINNDDIELQRKLKDYNLVNYLALYNVFSESMPTIAQTHKAVLDTIGCLPAASIDLISKYRNQLIIDAKNISAISAFYAAYPDYMQKDDILAIKTIQSMNDLVNGNINVDPYYSKTYCMQAVKQYLDVTAAYKQDLKRYNYDLFKYNANLAQNQLLQIWRDNAQADYQISFSLNKRTLSGRTNATNNVIVNALGVDIQLSDTGEFVDEIHAISDMEHFISTVNELLTAGDQWSTIVKELLQWKAQCVDRVKTDRPQLFVEKTNSSLTLYDYISSPLVILSDKSGQPVNGIDVVKRQIEVLVNDSYLRNDLNLAYKKFSTKYFGTENYAHKVPKDFNLSFSCEYLNNKYRSSAPKADPKFNAFINKDASAVLIEYGKAIPLKFATTKLGIISGADYDIDLKVRTFICAENGLPLPSRAKPREKVSDDVKLKNRPQKYIKRAFASGGVSSKILLSDKSVTLVNNSEGTCGVTASTSGKSKILFKFACGMPKYDKNDTSVYLGKIYLDGYKISGTGSFDRKTLINATHALEYLVKLTDGSKPKYKKKFKAGSNSITYRYSYPLSCGKCSGTLEFSIVDINGVCTIKSSPRFTFTGVANNQPVTALVNLTFTEECWDHIQSGKLEYSDISLNGAKYISGSVWVGSTDVQKITRKLFTDLTGLAA